MGCKDAVLQSPRTKKNKTVNCLTFEENTRKAYLDILCLFRALALPLHGIGKLEEETSKTFYLFLEKYGRISSSNFSRFLHERFSYCGRLGSSKHLPVWHKLYGWVLIGELTRRGIAEFPDTVHLIRYNSQICYVYDIIVLFKAYLCPSCDFFST